MILIPDRIRVKIHTTLPEGVIVIWICYECATIIQVDVDFGPDGTPVCGLVDLRGVSALAF
jgi:hypothetical protein